MGRSMHDTVYVQNKSLHQTLKNITPEEVFTRMKPEIKHFRLFGCPMYFHVPKEKKSKLDPLERKDIVNLQRHYRSTPLVRDRLRQAENIVLEKEIVFQRPRESQMEIDSETIPSPPSAVQRETNITPVDPGSPVDMFRDIAVGNKRPT
jgi:hypothetical protein